MEPQYQKCEGERKKSKDSRYVFNLMKKRTPLLLDVMSKVVVGASILDNVGLVPSLLKLRSSKKNGDKAGKKSRNP